MFWEVMLCQWFSYFQYFEGSLLPLFLSVGFSDLEYDGAAFPQNMGTTNPALPLHVPEDLNPQPPTFAL